MAAKMHKIDHINVVVRDLPKAQRFFEDLGFTVVASGQLQGAWIDTVTGLKNVQATYVALQLPNAQTKLELLTYATPIGTKDEKISELNRLGIRHLAFEVTNITEIVEKLKQKGVHFLSDIQEYAPTKKKLCYFLGPEQIVLELAEYEKK